MSPPLAVSPEAVFIAASAASQIVTNDHDNHANQWYDQHGIESSGETALVSNAALQLVNNFLDQLLFGFLSIARSTSLSALRPAVTEILKPKLAKDAINQADEELREYLGGGDDEDMLQSQTPDSPKDWDLELVWKRTRLRCMVYSSLGDMEEEDEDFYMEQENLDGGDEALGETVSPAVAIFLTSILEFMGEQALTAAGQAAYHRMRFIHEKERKETAVASGQALVAGRITVEEVDMERVAFDRTIGRLWRAWKKRIRSPVTDVHAFQQRPYPQDSIRNVTQPRSDNQGESNIVGAISETGEFKDKSTIKKESAADETETSTESLSEDEKPNDAAIELAPHVEVDDEEWLSTAASIPLPVRERDVAEILLPGLAYYSDDEEEMDGGDRLSGIGKKQKKSRSDDPSRPKSLMIFSHAIMAGLPTPTHSEPRTPDMPYSRKRANSLPTPSTSPYASPAAKRVKPSEDEEEAESEAVWEDAKETNASVSDIATDEGQAETEGKVDEVEKGVTKSVSAVVKQKKRPSLPLPFQTLVIGAAITTTSSEAVRVSSMQAESGSDHDDVDDEIDEFTEEPEIMTSSRVSISGRSNSPTTSEPSRPVSLSPAIPVRSPSVHSLRVIDVTGPRSPVTRSRNSSSEFNDIVGASRSSNASRTSSISAQAIAEEASTALGPRSSLSAKMSRTYTSESISEAEETPTRSEVATPKKGTTSAPRFEDVQAQVQSSQPIFGSTPRHAASPTPSQSPIRTHTAPASRPAPATTKVTILSSTTTSGTFFIDDKPEVPAKTQPTEIVVPERSAKRQTSASAASTATVAEAATAAVATSTGSSGSQAEQPPSPSRVVGDESSSVSSSEQQARAEIRTQFLADAEAVGRKQSVASIASASSKLVPKRASEESTVMRPEDVARNFEQLIHSDQTIQYTLTPESMRDIDSTRSIHDGSSVVFKSRKSEDVNCQSGDRSRSSSLNNRGDERRSASNSRQAAFDALSTDTGSSTKLNGPVPRSTHSVAPSVTSVSSRPRGFGPQAREARVPRESLADFADFIRATGPPGGSVAAVAPSSRNGSVSNAVRNLNSSAGLSKTSLDSGRVSTFSSRQRFQAREAAVDYKDDNSDLIDFIRRGPPATVGNNNPRIPRTVAPFRTTMDSDQMSGAIGGRAVDATIPNLRYSAASTNVTDSSMGSGVGLLKRDNNLVTKSGGHQTVNNKPDMPAAMPKRKTRRVRDPYAIDFSDEDDDFDVMGLGGGRRAAPAAKEESLLDFLNSVPPPAETSPSPSPFDISQTRKKQPPIPKKKASASSLLSRFTRNNSTSGNAGSRGLVSSSGSFAGSSFFDTRSISSRAGSTLSGHGRGHVPIQVNMPPGADKYGGAAATSSAGLKGGNRPIASSAGSGRVPMKKFEPREAQPVASRATQDLANFFRNSGPAQSFRN